MRKDYKLDTWEEFNKIVKDKRLYLLGALGANRVLAYKYNIINCGYETKSL